MYQLKSGIDHALHRRAALDKKLQATIKRIGKAAEHGDLKENAEFKTAIEDRDLLFRRIEQLSTEIMQAVPVNHIQTEHIQVGCHVRLRDSEVVFVGSFDSDPPKFVNYQTPFGDAFMCKKVGDTVHFRDKVFQVKEITVWKP